MALYFIALLPPESLQKRVHELKMYIAEKYGAKHALKLPAHITLQIPFRMETLWEEALLRLLNEFSSTQEEFLIKLKDFGHFGQKVIFINIDEHSSLIELHFNLQEKLTAFTQFKSGEKFPGIYPHITIATRDLHYKQFIASWAYFKKRQFIDEFMAQELILFKHNGKTWDILKTFRFN